MRQCGSRRWRHRWRPFGQRGRRRKVGARDLCELAVGVKGGPSLSDDMVRVDGGVGAQVVVRHAGGTRQAKDAQKVGSRYKQ